VTEAEWLACTDPQEMLAHLDGTASARRLRLFGCACCRRAWHLLVDERSPRAVELAERFADGLVARDDLDKGFECGWGVIQEWKAQAFGPDLDQEWDLQEFRPEWDDAAYCAAYAAATVCSGHGDYEDPYWGRALEIVSRVQEAGCLKGPEARDLLRCIFGNPFRPVTLSPAWQTPQVVGLAQAAYEHRDLPAGHLDPARLAVLADALEDAGSTDADLLGHLRGPGPHVRGCWALDLLLGKE
jgi:hypothetical protein